MTREFEEEFEDIQCSKVRYNEGRLASTASQGIKLEGVRLRVRSDGRIASAPVFPGTIQCLEDGVSFPLSVHATRRLSKVRRGTIPAFAAILTR